LQNSEGQFADEGFELYFVKDVEGTNAIGISRTLSA
jgi:hypothetical protein